MLLTQDVLDGLLAGSIDTVLRRWRKPSVKEGGEMRYAGWLLAIDKVEPIDEVSEEDAKRAGYPNAATGISSLDGYDGDLYRIRLHVKGEDPRIGLRNSADLSEDELARILAKLSKIDAASQTGPWTARVLRAISQHPGLVSTRLADGLQFERMALKANIRKLKELGLTESLEVGYRISPRGEKVLSHL